MTKEELRQQLQEQFVQHLQVNPDAVTLYAAEPKPETRPWKKKPSLLDRAFARDLAEIKKTVSQRLTRSVPVVINEDISWIVIKIVPKFLR